MSQTYPRERVLSVESQLGLMLSKEIGTDLRKRAAWGLASKLDALTNDLGSMQTSHPDFPINDLRLGSYDDPEYVTQLRQYVGELKRVVNGGFSGYR